MSTSTSHFFTFSNPQEIHALELLNYFQSNFNGTYYEMPYSVNAHAKYFYTLLYLRSALQLKTQVLTSCAVHNVQLSHQDFEKFVMDYLWFGNAYLEKITNRQGKLLALHHSPAKNTRFVAEGKYCFIRQSPIDGLSIHHFKQDSVWHCMQGDVNQEIYGVPEWLPAVQSAQLNEAATKFRLRYYNNGSHAGYILYITDPAQDENDIEALQEALSQSKGPGNFRNLLYYAPNGEKDGIKLIPISEVTAKDEFSNIKAFSRDDQLAACRVPPNLMGIVPTNSSGFGNVTDAANVFARNEIEPLQRRFLALNQWLGEEILQFKPYQIVQK